MLRQPSPFTNTDARGSISINRNLTNNPQSNSGGTGIATLLLGYTTGGAGLPARAVRHDELRALAVRAGRLELSNRLTVNLGLRYDVFVPDTERNNRLLGAAWDITGDAKNVLRIGYGRAFFPIGVHGHSFSKKTPNTHTWQVSYERQITSTLMGEVVYVGSKGENLTWCFNPNEVQPGPGSQAFRRLIQPLSNLSNMVQCEQTNRSSCNSLQTKLNKRFSRGLQFLASYTFGKSLDYAGSAASGGGAVGNAQSITLLDQSRGPSGFYMKHRLVLSWVWALPFGEGHSLAGGGFLKPVLEDWQFGGIVTLLRDHRHADADRHQGRQGRRAARRQDEQGRAGEAARRSPVRASVRAAVTVPEPSQPAAAPVAPDLTWVPRRRQCAHGGSVPRLPRSDCSRRLSARWPASSSWRCRPTAT